MKVRIIKGHPPGTSPSQCEAEIKAMPNVVWRPSYRRCSNAGTQRFLGGNYGMACLCAKHANLAQEHGFVFVD